MSKEITWVCDRCSDRHTGATPPLGWQKSFLVRVDADDLPTYSPYAIDEVKENLCGLCASDIAAAVHAVLMPVLRD
jgi:hypothetical protein